MSEEIPLFFFHDVVFFDPFASSEYRFDAVDPLPESNRAGSVPDRSPMEKLADWRSDGLIIFAFGVVYDKGGGPGLRKEFWYPEALVESSDDRVPG